MSASPSSIMRVLGIDIGGTRVKSALLAPDRPPVLGTSRAYQLPSAVELRGAIREAAGEMSAAPQAIGVSLPGLLDPQTGRVAAAVNVPALAGLPIEALVAEALGLAGSIPIALITDPLATAIDVAHAHPPSGRLLVLALGTGVGAAVLDDGKPLSVDGHSPGHLGQMDVSVAGDEVIGPDGGAGGLEGYIGAPALHRRHGPDLASAIARWSAAEPALLALARALRIAHAIYRPRHIFLCGGVGLLLRPVLPILHESIRANLTRIADPQWTLAIGDDVHHAARGAARLAQFTP